LSVIDDGVTVRYATLPNEALHLTAGGISSLK
jgi:hypothetical protein